MLHVWETLANQLASISGFRLGSEIWIQPRAWPKRLKGQGLLCSTENTQRRKEPALEALPAASSGGYPLAVEPQHPGCQDSKGQPWAPQPCKTEQVNTGNKRADFMISLPLALCFHTFKIHVSWVVLREVCVIFSLTTVLATIAHSHWLSTQS